MTAADFFLLTTILAVEARQWAERIAADLRAAQARQRKAAPTFTVGAACNLNTQLQKPGIHAIPGSILSLPRHTVTPSQFSRN